MAIDAALEYNCKPPKIRIRKSKYGEISTYNPRGHVIYLMSFHQNPTLVLHEVAHAVAVRKYKQPGHPKAWIGIYQHYLMKYEIYSKTFLKATMKAYGMPWCPLDPKSLK